MEIQGVLENLRLMAQHIGAKSVYGEPVVCGEKTIVPVASVAFGFGGGFGKGQDASDHGEGGGGGFGFRGIPAGYIEITPAGTRFVPVHERQKMAGAMLAGVFIGMLLGKLRGRR
jgi:uncharacterized spore protein YtfJ